MTQHSAESQRSAKMKLKEYWGERSPAEKAAAIGAGLATAAIVLAVQSENAPVSAEQIINSSHFEFDETVDSVAIDEGANLRESPFAATEPTNIMTQTTEEYVIPLTNGAAVERDANGEWYGIPLADIEAADKELADDLDGDNDGIIWVNEQRAAPEYTESE